MMLAAFVVSAVLGIDQTPAPASSTRISGRVIAQGADGIDVPVARCQVVLMPADPVRGTTYRLQQATTDENGQYLFENPAPGSYRIQAHLLNASTRSALSTTPLIELAAGQTVDNVDIVWPRAGAISGRIRDASGVPLANAFVMVIPDSERAGTERAGGSGARTSDLGDFRVEGLAPGTYYVAAQVRPMSPARTADATSPESTNTRSSMAATFYPGTTEPSAAQPIIVAAGETIDDISFAMQSALGFTVAGIIVDDSGKAVGGAAVVLSPETQGRVMRLPLGAPAQEDGRFLIADVVPGSYRVRALPMSGSGVDWLATPSVGVTVTDADVRGLRIVVRR